MIQVNRLSMEEAELAVDAALAKATELGVGSVIAVVALFYGVGYWNAFFNALLYLNDATTWPLQLVLRTYVLQGSALADTNPSELTQVASQSVQMAVVMIALIPILLVYPFVQRHFTKGVLTGAVKG